MKKSLTTNAKLVIVALVTLLAVMISSIVVASTSAKYVTTGNQTETASVAKWGVTVTATPTMDVFAQKYGTGDEISVSDSNGGVAPGASGGADDLFTVAGTPEVDVKIVTTYKVTYGAGWKAILSSENAYRPINIYSDSGFSTAITNKQGAGLYSDLTTTETLEYTCQIESEIMKANNALEDPTVACYWKWNFTGGDDAADTAAGDASKTNAENMKVTITVTVSVEQVEPTAAE